MQLVECDMLTKTIIFYVEAGLYKKVDVVIVGLNWEYNSCNDERIRFLAPDEAFKVWKEHNDFTTRICSYLGLNVECSTLNVDTIFLCPTEKEVKFKGTEKSMVVHCARFRVNQLIDQLNKNKADGASGYEKFLLAMGRAAFCKTEELEQA